ncbi:hypothetical protein BHM03_00039152 [Ensete ventricosum]|nr:hypothetical protein BHM03_00039152 [Ensete ventricosum]
MTDELSYNQMMGQNQVWALDQGSDDAVGARWEFVEGIKKLAGNMPGDYRRKTIRLAARMLEAARLVGRLCRPYPIFRVAFGDGAGDCTTYTRFLRVRLNFGSMLLKPNEVYKYLKFYCI